MRYLFASFRREGPTDSLFAFHEIGEDDLEVRKIELFYDGAISYCSSTMSSDPDYYLSNFPIPSTELATEAVKGCLAISGDPEVFDWLWRTVTEQMNGNQNDASKTGL